MRRFLLILLIILVSANVSFASQIPEDIQNCILKSFPKTNFRFDGVIILPDSTIYLPLFPAKNINVEKIDIKTTVPAGKSLTSKPEIIVFNNDYVLLKVLNDPSGKKTILSPTTIPNEVRNGLLPQDMLVPKGLIIPETLKGIIGNLDINTASEPGLKISTVQPKTGQNSTVPVTQLKNKTFYVVTGYSKNIQVINPENKAPAYALTQNHVPNCIKGYNNQYLLVTSFDSKVLNVISLFDEKVIKQFDFKTVPDEILIDNEKHLAYVSSPEDSSIYILNLDKMIFSKQIKINGMCEKLTLSDDGTKIFYFDKQTNEIWAIELDNQYLLKDIGKFPNTSKIAFNNNKIYLISRTKSHLAIIDYGTNGLIAEVEVVSKPVDIVSHKDNVFILGAGENVIQAINTKTDEITDAIYLNTKGFATNISKIEGTDIALISDTKASVYCVLNMSTKQIIKVNSIEVPVRSIVIMNKTQKIK